MNLQLLDGVLDGAGRLGPGRAPAARRRAGAASGWSPPAPDARAGVDRADAGSLLLTTSWF